MPHIHVITWIQCIRGLGIIGQHFNTIISIVGMNESLLNFAKGKDITTPEERKWL